MKCRPVFSFPKVSSLPIASLRKKIRSREESVNENFDRRRRRACARERASRLAVSRTENAAEYYESFPSRVGSVARFRSSSTPLRRIGRKRGSARGKARAPRNFRAFKGCFPTSSAPRLSFFLSSSCFSVSPNSPFDFSIKNFPTALRWFPYLCCSEEGAKG